MKAIILAPFTLLGFLTVPFVLTYCYPPSPSIKEVLRNPFHWPMFASFGIPFVIGFPFLWVCLKLE